MDKQTESAVAQAGATEAEPADLAGRREFVMKLAKAAIVPAVIVGLAANADPARAY